MIDRYTRFLLTVIATSLVYIAVRLTAVPVAHADAPPPRLVVQDINIARIGGQPLVLDKSRSGQQPALPVLEQSRR